VIAAEPVVAAEPTLGARLALVRLEHRVLLIERVLSALHSRAQAYTATGAGLPIPLQHAIDHYHAELDQTVLTLEQRGGRHPATAAAAGGRRAPAPAAAAPGARAVAMRWPRSGSTLVQ
jgi:hypothetical protein